MAGRTDEGLRAIIRPLPQARYEVDTHWGMLEKTLSDWSSDYGLDLSPDFQRGHVWTASQQQRYVENVLRGAVPTSGLTIQFNCAKFESRLVEPNSDLPGGFQIMDGLQRLTAVREFMAGNVRPFSLTLEDLAGTSFTPKGMTYRLRFAVFCFQYKREVLDHYLALNEGGTPHSDEEISRIREMRDRLAPLPKAQA
ncbi:hypothetical protein WK66_25345 [Burkholderia ubonensis]|uniref:DUF262 domain-containing protein n=1 Tax=Burkholderia ubonensis TaxID=101571 RepID=UPI0007552C46|nr:DUF262 domain-containing protein [Burkholderia ubonensis]KVU39144.1 hypothetical protein WK66_25345 [Burkholderia ubonensis]